jgi:4-coumarate--CoA ligase
MSKSIYDAESKIWRGPIIPSIYNESASLGQIVLSILKKNPSSISQISADTGVELTCYEMRVRTIRIAMKLNELGYKKGDIAGVLALNSENLAPLVFACFTLGIGMNFLAPNANKKDIVHMWGIVRPKFIFCDPRFLEVIKEGLNDLKLSSPIMTLVESVQGHQFIGDMVVANGGEEDYCPPNLEKLDEVIGIILCSSGTTGLQKAVCLSQKQLICQMVPFWWVFSGYTPHI